MVKLIILLTKLFYLNSYISDEAYYLSLNSRYENDVDIFRVNLESVKINRAYSFQDKILSVNFESHIDFQFHPRFLPPANSQTPQYHIVSDSLNLSLQTLSLAGMERSMQKHDSLLHDEKWYKISISTSTDGWVGGRPSQDDYSISVSDIGVIYSYSSWFNAHNLFMLSHKDSTKQKALESIYRYLDEKGHYSYTGYSWSKVADLVGQQKFESCIKELNQKWLNVKSDLKLLDYSCIKEGRMLRFEARIKNTSKRAYALPERFEMAPSQALIFNESNSQIWDLIDTHYGKHFKLIRQQIFLQPGEEVSFSHSFYPYSVNSTYSGFQIFSNLNLAEWLLVGEFKHENSCYSLYPHRKLQ